MSSEARAYLTRALDLLQQNSIDAGTVDWPTVRAEAFANVPEAQSDADTYPAIRLAVEALHDEHTRLFTAAEATSTFEQPQAPNGPPTGRILPGGYALLTVPAMKGDDQAVASYLQAGEQAVRDLDRSHPCGWLIDLRQNTGGNVWPMLTTVVPLLDGPILGSFVDAAGHRTAWTLKDGRLFAGDSPQLTAANTYTLARPRPPVAILTGPNTASSGEATLIAFRGQPQVRTFGQPTAGVPSGNQGFTLSDNALLLITVSNDADRTGHVYPNLTPIPPDQSVAEAGSGDPPGSDPVITAATRWLAGRSHS